MKLTKEYLMGAYTADVSYEEAANYTAMVSEWLFDTVPEVDNNCSEIPSLIDCHRDDQSILFREQTCIVAKTLCALLVRAYCRGSEVNDRITTVSGDAIDFQVIPHVLNSALKIHGNEWWMAGPETIKNVLADTMVELWGGPSDEERRQEIMARIDFSESGIEEVDRTEVARTGVIVGATLREFAQTKHTRMYRAVVDMERRLSSEDKLTAIQDFVLAAEIAYSKVRKVGGDHTVAWDVEILPDLLQFYLETGLESGFNVGVKGLVQILAGKIVEYC